jgi:hypothetical protein
MKNDDQMIVVMTCWWTYMAQRNLLVHHQMLMTLNELQHSNTNETMIMIIAKVEHQRPLQRRMDNHAPKPKRANNTFETQNDIMGYGTMDGNEW